MKLYFYLIAGIFLASNHARAEETESTLLPIQKIFAIEQGFDNNDSVEIAVLGNVPNTCYKLGKGKALVDKVNKKILVSVEGYVKQSQVCLEVVTPFLEVIQVGLLNAGDYEIVSMNNADISATLNINPSSSEDRDDHLYAPVDTVELSVEKSFDGQKSSLRIKGTYPYMLKGCMRIVSVETYLTNNNILVVQPISQLFTENGSCNPADTDSYNRFSYHKNLDQEITDHGLIHVRTLNGRAVNKLFNFTRN